MTYVVVENCIKCKYMDCVEVCPVDCFYGTVSQTGSSGAGTLIRRAVILKNFNAAGSEGRSGNSPWQASPVGVGQRAMSPRDREVPKGSGGSKTDGAF